MSPEHYLCEIEKRIEMTRKRVKEVGKIHVSGASPVFISVP